MRINDNDAKCFAVPGIQKGLSDHCMKITLTPNDDGDVLDSLGQCPASEATRRNLNAALWGCDED